MRGCREDTAKAAPHTAGCNSQDTRPSRPEGADGRGPAFKCIACGGSCGGHSHRACVVLGVALHRMLDPDKDMKDVVDVILRLLLWDWREAHVAKKIQCLSYAPSCDVIAASCQKGKLVFINALTGEKIGYPVGCGSAVYSISSQDDMIAAGCNGGAIKLFTLKKSGHWGEVQRQTPLTCSSTVWSLDFKDNIIAAGCGSGEIKRFALQESGDWGEIQSKSILRCDDAVLDLSFSPDGQHIAAACRNARVYIFSLNQQCQDWEIRPESPLTGHDSVVSGVIFHPEKPNILVSCSYDQTIKMWDITSGSCLSTLSCDNWVRDVSFSPDGQHIAAACDDGGVYIFSVNQQSQDFEIRSECPMRGHSDGVTGVVFSADGQWLISSSLDKTIRLWDAPAGAVSPV